MIGTVDFYSLRGSLSAAEYPLLTGSEEPFQSFENVAYAAGLQTSVCVPVFVGWDVMNVARIGQDYYWITDAAERTATAGQVIYRLSFMAPTSLLKLNDRVTGVWKRTPVPICEYLTDSITSDLLRIKTRTYFDALDCPDIPDETRHRIVHWIQVSGHDTNGNAHTYGGFVYYDPTNRQYDWTGSVPAWNGSDIQPSVPYIDYRTWIGSISAFTVLTPETIDDISMSRRCPYNVHDADDGLGPVMLAIKDGGGNPVLPNLTFNGSVCYDLDQIRAQHYLPFASQTIYLVPDLRTRQIGHAAIRDWNNNEVLSIPMTFPEDNIRITATMHADVSGIYCIVQALDSQIVIPEGKIPYYGDSAATYRAYQMEGDREAMRNAVEVARHSRETAEIAAIGNAVSGALQSAAMGALTGNPITAASGAMSGVAGGITSLYGADRAYQLSTMQASMDYDLSRHRALAQPTSGYNVAYGTIYAYLEHENSISLCIQMPASVGDGDITEYRRQFGYPCEGAHGFIVTMGYYQGRLIDRVGGPKIDALNAALQSGFRFISQGSQ